MSNFKSKLQNLSYKLSNKMANFMRGRYGVDQLYMFGTYFILALLIIELFVRNSIFNILVLVLLVYNTYRPFSKNVSKRYKENQAFLKIKNKVVSYFKFQKKKFSERKTYCYKKCPNCKKTLRFKKVKGKHEVCCPNCHTDFEIKI